MLETKEAPVVGSMRDLQKKDVFVQPPQYVVAGSSSQMSQLGTVTVLELVVSATAPPPPPLEPSASSGGCS